jgi:hypothetical protein
LNCYVLASTDYMVENRLFCRVFNENEFLFLSSQLFILTIDWYWIWITIKSFILVISLRLGNLRRTLIVKVCIQEFDWNELKTMYFYNDELLTY